MLAASRTTARGRSHIVATVSTSTPNGVPTDASSSYRAIENLIATYAELVDDGDFARVGILLVDAIFTGGAGSVRGGDAIEKMLRDNLIMYICVGSLGPGPIRPSASLAEAA